MTTDPTRKRKRRFLGAKPVTIEGFFGADEQALARLRADLEVANAARAASAHVVTVLRQRNDALQWALVLSAQACRDLQVKLTTTEKKGSV